MREIYNTIAILFIIVTFGFVSVNIKYSDGSTFNYRGWVNRSIDKKKDKIFSEYPCSCYLHNALRFICDGEYEVAYEEICHALLRSGDKLTECERKIFDQIRGKE